MKYPICTTNTTYIQNSMESDKIIKIVIFACIFLSLISIPVIAYSNDATGWFEQGNAFVKNKSYNGAIQAYDKAITLEPVYYEAWNGKADALNRNKQFFAALEASDRVLALKPDYVPGWINRGYILYNLGRYDEELRAYETAITLDPASPEAWFNKGYSLAGMQRYDEAIAAFDTVQVLDPTYPNLAANKRIAEQNRDATPPVNASERTPSTIPIISQIKTTSTLPPRTLVPSMPSTEPEAKQSPVSVGAVIGIFSLLVVIRQVGKKKRG
jgi:tetratricopeptide (TPR) repeat protein